MKVLLRGKEGARKVKGGFGKALQLLQKNIFIYNLFI